MSDTVQNKVKEVFDSIGKQIDAHLVESIISLFNQGVLKHYVRSPKTKIDQSNFTMSVEAASGVKFEGREKIIELQSKLDKAIECIEYYRDLQWEPRERGMFSGELYFSCDNGDGGKRARQYLKEIE